MGQPSAKVATIEGVRPVIEALRAGRRRVLDVVLPEGEGSAGLSELSALLADRGIPSRRAAVRGVSARAEPFPEEPFESLLTAAAPVFLVALDRVTDVGNLGSIARTAGVAGAGGIILEQRRAPPIGPGALRASAGALEHLRVGRTPNLRKALDLARAEGLSVLLADAEGDPLERVDPALLKGGLVWVFGSEDRGARASIRELADARVGIPHHGGVASLGVAVAAAHLLLRTAEIRFGP